MADVQLMKTAAETALADAFAAAKATLPGGKPVAAQREAAFARFEAQGLPHRRVEEWKYTDLRALMREAKPIAAPPDAKTKARAKDAGALLRGVDARRLVFVDGVFAPDLSDLAKLEAGLTIANVGAALANGDAFVTDHLGRTMPAERDIALALNTAFMDDGAAIRVAKNAKIVRPIHLVFAFTSDKAASVFDRSLIVLEEGAAATFIESWEGPDGIDYQINYALEMVVRDGARLDYVKIGGEGDRALHVATVLAELGADVTFNAFSFTTGGAIVRNQFFLRCAGAHSTLTLNGASLLRGKQHVDNTLVIDHAVGECTGRETFKSVLDDEARAVFQGKTIVEPDAQKTDSKMASHALLLSETAEADNKPELEIFADDVICGHGATSGALDEELLFYLRARGIPMKEAESLLIQAFVGEAIEQVENEGIREALIAAAVRWLAARG